MCPKPQRDDYNFREGWQSARRSKSNHRGSARRTCCSHKPKVQFQGTSTMTNHEFVDGSTPGMGHSRVLLIPRVRQVQREGAWVTFQLLYHSRGQWTTFWSVAVWLEPCISLAVLLSIPPTSDVGLGCELQSSMTGILQRKCIRHNSLIFLNNHSFSFPPQTFILILLCTNS